jgi:hypothetical protein
MTSLKEHSIREYISGINFRADDWSLTRIKEDLRKFLGEEPGIDVVYKKDVMVNETTGEAYEFKDIHKVLVIFTDTNDKYKKLEFLVGEKL